MPMLGTFGANSARGFGRGLGPTFAGPLFVSWGSGTPSWSTSPSYNITLDGYNGQYGAGTDTFLRYIFVTSRGSGYGSLEWLCAPILQNGSLGTQFRIAPTSPVPDNSFGGCWDTIRGRTLWNNYASTNVFAHALPAGLSGLSSNNPIGTPPTGTTSLTHAYTASYGFNNNDAVFHNYATDEYWLAGRDSGLIRRYAATTSSTWNINSSITAGAGAVYGMCVDPSSNCIITCRRSNIVYIHNSSGTQITNISLSGPSSIEDVVIGWNGDLFAYQSGTATLYRYARLA